MKSIILILVMYLVYVAKISCDSGSRLIFGYECHAGKCLKIELNENQSAVSLPVCRIFCGDSIGTIWPKPVGPVTFNQSIVRIDRASIEFQFPNNWKHDQFWLANKERFFALLDTKQLNPKTIEAGGRSLLVKILTNEDDATKIPKLTIETDESYRLQTFLYENKVEAIINAKTCFGARHGLETLSQLIVYDDIDNKLKILADVDIFDEPAYKWRGIMLDTARSFYSTSAIKRTLNGMAMTKLNTFHWHITDAQSFPLYLKSQPELSKYGAYSTSKIYTQADISDIIEYGRVRGIRVIPEFDAPAHVGEGWQHKNMTTCFNAQPWKNFCMEPPCGQLDPTNKDLYLVLEDIYKEILEIFDPDVFHMGGDEVSISCWNSSKSIRNWMVSQNGWGLKDDDFMRLWGYFQTNALKRVDMATKTKKPIILWTSKLTDVPYIDNYLNNTRYIIQIWTAGSDSKIKEILKRGFPIIISNYDALYFDCGGPGWVTDGNNWCSPYIGWQKVYENNLQQIARGFSQLILGAEATIWSEQIDEFTLDSHVWPRASALAERLWSNPSGNWRQAEPRILLHRERLTENGIGAEALQPEWCVQNENECPIDAYH